jgi:undecaprenyl-diphosphatase
VAELAYAYASGAYGIYPVWVQLPPRAPKTSSIELVFYFPIGQLLLLFYTLDMQFDIIIFQAVNSLPHNAVLDQIALVIHYLTLGGLIYFPFFIYWLLHRNKAKRLLAKMELTAILITYVINDLLLKTTFQRLRPYQNLIDILYIPPAPLSYAMPSGQAATAFAVATLWWLTFPRAKSSYLVVLFAFIVGLDRIYMGHHYPSDVLVGAIVGIVIAALIYSQRRVFQRAY